MRFFRQALGAEGGVCGGVLSFEADSRSFGSDSGEIGADSGGLDADSGSFEAESAVLTTDCRNCTDLYSIEVLLPVS